VTPLADRLREALKNRQPAVWKQRPEILLCPQIPKPMHSVAPRLILGSVWWNETRQAAYRSTDYHCVACGVHKTCAKGPKWLEGHELYRIDYAVGRMVYLETVPLCHYCHNYIHAGRLEALLDADKITDEKYEAILSHGDAVLKAAKERRPLVYNGFVAVWKRWRLVINGKEYPPVYRDYEAWLKAMRTSRTSNAES